MSNSKIHSTQPEKEALTSLEDSEFDELCSEAHKNAKEDRKALKEHLKRLDVIASEVDAGPETMVVITDAIAKTSEAILKANMQIIQIAQLKLKKVAKNPINDNSIDDLDAEDMYKLIEGEEKVKQN